MAAWKMILVVVATWLLAGSIVLLLMCRWRPELFDYRGQFFTPLAVCLIVVWPLAAVSALIGLAILPARRVWQNKYNNRSP